MDVEEHLQWEARWRMRAAMCTAVAALLILAATLVQVAVGQSNVDELTSRLLFAHEHKSGLLLATVLGALAMLALAGPLVYLYRATKFRRPETPKVAYVMALLGPVAVAIAQISYYFVYGDKATQFATHGSRTYEEAKHLHVFDSTEALIPQAVGLMGLLALGFALVMVSLNAMRAGLLTRFMGVLGIIVGVLLAIQQIDPPGVIRFFWLGALAVLLSGRWPKGVPPAWRTGEAQPWPTQQEMREARERAAGKTAAPEPAPAPAGAAPQTRPHPTSKKRKRKKR